MKKIKTKAKTLKQLKNKKGSVENIYKAKAKNNKKARRQADFFIS